MIDKTKGYICGNWNSHACKRMNHHSHVCLWLENARKLALSAKTQHICILCPSNSIPAYTCTSQYMHIYEQG